MHFRRFFCLLVAFNFVALSARGAEWQTDYEQALATAKNARKCVLLDFTGSDWCPPCIEMKKVAFSKPAFLKYAEEKLILVEIDYPRRKMLSQKVAQQNERLKEQYGIDRSGFPTVVLLNPDGKILDQLEGYSGEGPADIIAWVEKFCGN
jgi:thioredoxin-related protein